MMTLPLGLDLAMVIGASLGLVRTDGSIVTVHLVARGAFFRSLGSPGSACTADRTALLRPGSLDAHGCRPRRSRTGWRLGVVIEPRDGFRPGERSYRHDVVRAGGLFWGAVSSVSAGTRRLLSGAAVTSLVGGRTEGLRLLAAMLAGIALHD